MGVKRAGRRSCAVAPRQVPFADARRAPVPRDGRRGEDRAHPALPGHAAPLAGRLRGPPLSQGRSLGRDGDLPAALRRRRPRGLPGRRPRHRHVGGRRGGRVHGARAPGSRRDDRVAGRAGVVERERGDVRHVLLGLQLPPGRRAPPAGIEGDHPDLRDRPALHGRRPLRRRSAARDRLLGLPRVHGGPDRPAAGPVALRGRLAGGMAPTDRGERSVGARVAGAPERRRLLASRLGVLRLRRRSKRRRW